MQFLHTSRVDAGGSALRAISLGLAAHGAPVPEAALGLWARALVEFDAESALAARGVEVRKRDVARSRRSEEAGALRASLGALEAGQRGTHLGVLGLEVEQHLGHVVRAARGLAYAVGERYLRA